MTENHYLAASVHHQDNLRADCMPGTCSSEQPALVAYSAQDLTPYTAVSSRPPPTSVSLGWSFLRRSARGGNSPDSYTYMSQVSSFNYPAAADSSLLTPVSNAASPPLQQRQSTKGMQYTSQAVSGPQQPTPPSTSGMYYPSYDINASSQSPSPLTVHPHAAEAHFDLAPYMGQSPHPSPKDEVPPPINQYLGHYTVSGNCNESGVANSFSEYPDFNDVDSGYLARAPGQMQVSAAQLHRHMVVTSAAQAPTLTQPHPSQLRPQAGGIEDLRDPGMLAHGLPGPGGFQSRISDSPGRRQPQRKQKLPQRRAPRNSRQQQNQAQMADAAQQADQTPPDEGECEPLKLNDKAPVEDRFLFELRQKYIGEKGKGMWEDISAEYAAKYQPMEKAALQMKISRAVAKYGEWPPTEVSLENHCALTYT